MLKVIKFRKVKNQFLTKLKNNIKTVKQSKNALTSADKTSKTYRLSKEEHEELLANAVTSNYKKANNSIKNSIEAKLSKLPSNEKVFNESVLIYQEVLDKSGYKHQLPFQKTSTNGTQRRRIKKNILWFNPPFSEYAVTKTGKTFLRLIDKHFPPHHKLHKFFNKKKRKNKL